MNGEVHTMLAAARTPSPVELGEALDRVDDGFFSLDRDWRIRYVNAAAAAMLGRKVEDLVGQSIWAEFPTAVGTTFDHRFREAVETRQLVEFEEYFDLLGMWFSIRAYPSADGLTLVFRDTTQLRRLAARYQTLLVQLLEAENRERARIAADVHDDSVQALGAVTLHLQLLRHHLPLPSPKVVSLLATLGHLVANATDRLRALLFTLEPTDPAIPIAQSLRTFAAHLFDGSPVHWSVDDVDAGDELPPIERSQALRIAREALSNAGAHARASEVIVTLRGRGDGLEMLISDNGVAVDPLAFVSAPGHRGLATMRDRAAIIGGTCTMEPATPHGCTVRVYIPRLKVW